MNKENMMEALNLQKALLLPVRPKECFEILTGRRVIDVRKNTPRLFAPFEIYLYCTQARKTPADWLYILPDARTICLGVDDENRKFVEGEGSFLNGSIIGRAVCHTVKEYEGEFNSPEFYESVNERYEPEDFWEYGEYDYYFVSDNEEDNEPLQGSGLSWEDCRRYFGKGIKEFCGLELTETRLYETFLGIEKFGLTRPPQSMVYVNRIEHRYNPRVLWFIDFNKFNK